MESFKPVSNDDLLRLSLKQSLSLADLIPKSESSATNQSLELECIFCSLKFRLEDQNAYLAHLLKEHQFVISEVDQIGNFLKYNSYWKDRLTNGVKIEDVCFKIKTNTGANDIADSETFWLLSDDLPEDNELRKKLNIFKLEKALKQLELERNDTNFYRQCFFCNEVIGNTKSKFLTHWSNEHNFSIGNPDNIVYFDEFYKTLNERFERLQCLYCNKIFYDKFIHKEHMRKKKHKCIDPNNKEFDRFYIINYLEYHTFWQEIKLEKDYDELNKNVSNESELDDWVEPAQTYYCLFCTSSYQDETEIMEHMRSAHDFDFRANISDNKKLSFYNQVKVINYIRRQTFLGQCHICARKYETREELLEHFRTSGHVKEFPSRDLWDQPEYFFSTFEDDTLLCLLDDDAYSQDELKVKVIPEDLMIRKLDSEVLKEIKDLKINN